MSPRAQLVEISYRLDRKKNNSTEVIPAKLFQQLPRYCRVFDTRSRIPAVPGCYSSPRPYVGNRANIPVTARVRNSGMNPWHRFYILVSDLYEFIFDQETSAAVTTSNHLFAFLLYRLSDEQYVMLILHIFEMHLVMFVF